jgi:hypothetical protein
MKFLKPSPKIIAALICFFSFNASAQIMLSEDKLNCRFWKIGASTIIDAPSMQLMQGLEKINDKSALFLLLQYWSDDRQNPAYPITCLSNGLQSSLVATALKNYLEYEIHETVKIIVDEKLKKYSETLKNANEANTKVIVEALVNGLSKNPNLIKNLRDSIGAGK